VLSPVSASGVTAYGGFSTADEGLGDGLCWTSPWLIEGDVVAKNEAEDMWELDGMGAGDTVGGLRELWMISQIFWVTPHSCMLVALAHQ